MVAFEARHAFALEHRQELVLAEFEKRVALAAIELLQAEDILVKGHCLLDIADLDGDVIAAIHLHTHFLNWLVVMAG